MSPRKGTKGGRKPNICRCMLGAVLSWRCLGRHRLRCQPCSGIGENPPYGYDRGIEETSASSPPRRCAIERSAHRLSPEVLEPVRRQLGVAHRVLDVLVTEIGLQRASIVAGLGRSRNHAGACADGSETAFWRGPRSDRIVHGRLWASLAPSRSVIPATIADRTIRTPAS